MRDRPRHEAPRRTLSRHSLARRCRACLSFGPLWVQVLLDGLLVGAIFALAAYGMALVVGVMNIINISQGELVTLGGA